MIAAIKAAGNDVLAVAPPDELQTLLPHFELETESTGGEVLHERGEVIDHVYFPLDSVISLVVNTEDGEAVEAAIIGRDGMAGISVFLGGRVASTTAVVQIPGSFLRMPATEFAYHLDMCPGLRHAIARYADSLIMQLAQSAACLRVHPIKERCARWLLAAHDRVDTPTFRLTHEFLATMLGTQRPTVTIALTPLREAGLIDYRRGTVTIRDREGLEATACECYSAVNRSRVLE